MPHGSCGAPGAVKFTYSMIDGISMAIWSSRKRCHLFIRDGLIDFCNDSQHELAGKTAVDMVGASEV